MPLNVTYTAPAGQSSVTFGNGLPAAPTAEFIGTPTSGTTPLAVTFTNQSTGAIDSYSWAFGDGTTSTATNPTKAYLTAASFTVALTATGPGGSNTKTRTGYVVASAPSPGPTPPPPPPPPSPATPVAPSGAILLRPMSTWTGSEPWTTGHVFAPGEIATGETVGAAGATVQVDARTYYADGSLRYAVLSGVTTQADIPLLRNGLPASGTNVAEPNIAASVAFANVVDASSAAVGGGSFTADISTARTNGLTAWDRTTARKVRQILGPIMSEFHYFVPTPDAHTHVWFYVRAYLSGQVEVETVVENGWLQVASPGRRTYDATVTIGGSVRYTGTGLGHYHHTRWSRVDWVGTAPTAIMAQSTAHLQTTGLVPSYGVTSLASTAYTDGPVNGTKHNAYTADLALRPAPFSYANIDTAMGSGGDNDAYGIVPGWAATYLVEQNMGAYYSCLANGRAMGRFCLHYRDETTGRPHRGSSYLSLGVNDSSSGLSENQSFGVSTPAPAGGIPATSWYFSHSPAAAFVAAVLTGRWSMLEEQQFQVGAGELQQGQTFGGYRVNGWWAQNREQGWKFRDRVQHEAITPSALAGVDLTTGADYDVRQEALGRLGASVDFAHDLYVSGTDTSAGSTVRANALGLPYQNADFDIVGGSTADGVVGYGGLQTAIFVLGHLYGVVAQPALGSTQRTRLVALGAHFGKYPSGVLGAQPSGSTWNWRMYAWVTLGIGTPGGSTNGDSSGNITLPASWDAAWTAIQAAPHVWFGGFPAPSANYVHWIRARTIGGTPTGDLIADPRPTFASNNDVLTDIQMFWQAANYMHEAAGRSSISGADVAIQRLIGSDSWVSGEANYFRTRPEFAVKSRRLLPVWVPAVGECVELQGAGYVTNTFLSQAPNPSVGPDADAFRYVIDAYSGGGYNPHYITASTPLGAMFFHGGGHGNSNDNSTTVLGIGYNSLTFDRLDNPTFPLTLGTDEANWAEHQDGRPYSAHTADCMVVIPPSDGGGPMGSLVRVMTQASGSAVWRNPLGGAGDTVDSRRAHAFNFATATWSRFGSSSGLPSGSIGPYAVTAYDPDLQRIWFVQSVNETNCPTLSWINVLDGSRGSQACTSPTFAVDTVTMRFVKTGGKRLLVMGGKSPSSDTFRLNYIDLDAIGSAWLGATLSTSIPVAYHNSFDWAAPRSRLYVFTGDTATGVYEIAAPATLTDTWTVTVRTFSNGTTMTGPASSPAKRWSYVEEADCFVYVPRAGTLSTCAVYAYRPH